MQTWRTQMPRDMLLRSDWDESSLSAPAGRGSIDTWSQATGEPRVEPLPLQGFLRYAEWFRERFVGDSDPADVVAIDRAAGLFRIVTATGGEVDAHMVVLAVGVTPFSYAPPPFADALGEGVEFATAGQTFERLRGRRVIVVGAGQGGLESAGLAARAGADVEILVRSAVRWFADREPTNLRGPLRSHLYRLAYPAIGYGPPVLNRIGVRPDLFAALPGDLRTRINRRALRAGGSPWLRQLIDGKVRVSEGASATRLERAGGALRLTLTDGSIREADTVILATGYRFDMDRLDFMSRALRDSITLSHGWPVLDRYFRSSEPSVCFVGFPAEYRFGPMSRFVLGTDFAARRLAQVNPG